METCENTSSSASKYKKVRKQKSKIFFEAVVGVSGEAANNNGFNPQTLLLCNKNR